jgi:uncharacterized protein (DUF1499 family)
MIGLFGQKSRAAGIVEGALAPCPSSPNCVSSMASIEDRAHHVEPFRFSDSPSVAWSRICNVIEQQPRVRIVERSENYLHAEFRTALLRYVDDVEFLLDAASGLIHVRSASRLGRADFGVNRRRVEALRSIFYLN